MRKKLLLLPHESLIRTNAVDHADWNYKFMLRFIQRRRFRLALSLMRNNHYGKILEIGYGSGIFMPTLSRYCDSLYGIDVHPFSNEVSDVLLRNSVNATLVSDSVSKMSFPDSTFDMVMSVSTFEFIRDKQDASREILRVLKKDGVFILITPAQSRILDLGFRFLTRENASRDFGEGRSNVLPVISEHFKIRDSIIFPPVLGQVFPVYKAMSLIPR